MDTTSHSCYQSHRDDKSFAKLERQLKACKLKLREQQLFTKFVGEWLLHKFGFDIQLRIKMHRESLPKEMESEEDDDYDDKAEDEEEEEVVELARIQRQYQQPQQQNRGSVINVVSFNRNIKRRRVSGNENYDNSSSAMPTLVESSGENLGYIENNSMKSTAQTITPTNSFTEVSNNNNNNSNPIPIEEDDLLCYERNDYNYDNQSSSSYGSSSNKTLTTKTGHVIHIVHEDDEEVDIKYHSMFTSSELSGMGESGDQNKTTHDDSVITSNRISSGGVGRPAGSPSPDVVSFETLINKLNYTDTFFDFHWILQMKKYQPKMMPYTMFIKRDDIRQWFEYIPNNQQPALGRYRCRLCYKYVREMGLPTKYWGPMESSEGQLKKSDTDNRNTINLHVTRKSHQEILLKLKKENSNDIPQQINFSKVLRKQLLDSLERE